MTHEPSAPADQAVLVIDPDDLTVTRATPTAVRWLGLPRHRLLDRSLMLSLPQLGQALAVAIAAGLGSQPRELTVDATGSELARLHASARRQEAEIVIAFRLVPGEAVAEVPAR